ncbi:hypothetical protein K435DRAFT_972480 [Dendrothele bispora CBS 962.96]|uniref:Uncharacterized protein n=1 Tax=Dendrothele bispora (strain CBS 962.96) TaxID=1314807 RepID=A0A4S8KYU6_DENBC|nr:hypothetical protein K435DRAFT_972480 [Dendrothele bispora CBS 962.96]
MDLSNSTILSSGPMSGQTITTTLDIGPPISITTVPPISTTTVPGGTEIIDVNGASSDPCGVGPCSELSQSSASDLMGQVLTIASIIGTQVDGGSNPLTTPKILSADTANSTSDNVPDDVPNSIPDADTTNNSQGTTPTDLSPDTAEHTNLGLSSTTKEILITSTKQLPQPGQTVTDEVVIITSTTVEPISQSQVSTPQGSGNLTSATGRDQRSNLTGASFFDNKPAVIGTFTVIGIIFLAFTGFLVIKILRKRKILTTTKERIYGVVGN